MSYRALARSAPIAFFPLGLFARLPYAVTPLGSLLLLQHATGSPSFAGLTAGTQSIAIAVAGFAAGELAAHFDVRRTGMALAVLNALAATLFVVTSMSASRPAMFGGAILVGLTQPHVGLLVRVHWSYTLGRGTTILRTAFSYESAVDELSFIIGPAAVGLFAALRPGTGPLLGMTLLLLVTSIPLAAMYTPSRMPHEVTTGRLPMQRTAQLGAAMAAIGAIFGSLQVVTTAHAANDSGFLYSCLGIGSMISGVAYAWLPRSFQVHTRHIVFSVTLVLSMAIIPLTPWPPLGILVAGFFIAPYMVTLYALADAFTPPAHLPAAIAALGAGGPVGTAIGQAVTGVLIDGPGLDAAWFAPTGYACAALLVAMISRRSPKP